VLVAGRDGDDERVERRERAGGRHREERKDEGSWRAHGDRVRSIA
jgi:hypothetical protein